MQQESCVIAKSPNDDRQYLALKLKNQLKVVLIYDPKAEKAACSISVGVGSLCDNQRSLGVAHFLQHMLFMGSKKFPLPNEYTQFITLSSGYDNAYTSDDETNYYFQVSNNKFKQGVQRISDFFVQALLTKTCVQKERQAVHEQCMLRTGQDNSRKWQILKYFANGPYHNHSIGNNKTLGHQKVHEDLVQFYNKYYSSNRTNAVLLSALPLNQMKQQLVPYLEAIENKKLADIVYQPHFLAKDLSKLVQMQSIKDQCIMQFFWIIDSVKPYYKLHPQKYIIHVLGHQGANSLLSILKQKQWATQIISYSHDLPVQTIIGLELHLTQFGKQHYEEVYNIVIDYTAWLNANEQIYKQISQASQLAFQFKQKGNNSDYVTKLSSVMHDIPLPQILSYNSLYAPFNQQVIQNFIHQLNPFNLILFFSHSQQLENPILQAELGGKFIYKNLPNRVSSGHPFMALNKNAFLPVDTTIYEPSKDLPQKQDNIWFCRSDYNLCKGGIHLKVKKQESEIFLQFYGRYLQLLLKQLTYDAQNLKLNIQYLPGYELVIKIFGFSDTVIKLFKQLNKYFNKIHKTQKAQQLFQLIHESLSEQYQNFYQGDTDQIVEEILQTTIIKQSITIQNRIKELQQYNYQNICQRIDQFWKNCGFQWIVVGNFQKYQVTQLLHKFQLSLNPSPNNTHIKINCMKIKKKQQPIIVTKLSSQQISTGGVILYHQIGPYSQKLYYTLKILQQYIKQPYFDQLRTQKQLAYYLRAYQDFNKGILSLNYILISSNTDPFQISKHIKTFINQFLTKIESDLNQQKLNTLRNAVRSYYIQPYKNLQQYFNCIIHQVYRGSYVFDRKTNQQQIMNYLNQITKEDIIMMLKNSLDYCMQVWVVSVNHEQKFNTHKSYNKIQLQKLKKKSQYYQDLTIKQ